MIYIVDIDHTICYTPNMEGENLYGLSEPYVSNIEKINTLYDEGHTIYYWTARGSSTGKDWKQLTIDQLNEWNCKYTDLWMNKPSYDFWIDDKAIHESDFFK